MEASKITDIEGAALWATEHDAKIDSWWTSQHEWNARVEAQHKELRQDLTTRIETSERRWTWIAGFVSCLGMVFTTAATIFTIWWAVSQGRGNC